MSAAAVSLKITFVQGLNHAVWQADSEPMLSGTAATAGRTRTRTRTGRPRPRPAGRTRTRPAPDPDPLAAPEPDPLAEPDSDPLAEPAESAGLVAAPDSPGGVPLRLKPRADAIARSGFQWVPGPLAEPDPDPLAEPEPDHWSYPPAQSTGSYPRNQPTGSYPPGQPARWPRPTRRGPCPRLEAEGRRGRAQWVHLGLGTAGEGIHATRFPLRRIDDVGVERRGLEAEARPECVELRRQRGWD